jgi:hypothetical protein
MKNIDLELGLMEEEGFLGADGLGNAKVAKEACLVKCQVTYPTHLMMRKDKKASQLAKREVCNQKCYKTYDQKVALIQSQTGKTIIGGQTFDPVEEDYIEDGIGAGAGAGAGANTDASSGGGQQQRNESGGLGTGAMVGIAVGAVAVVVLIGYLAFKK